MGFNPLNEHLGLNTDIITTNATVSDWNKRFESVACSSSNLTITLPASVSGKNNGSIIIRKSDSTNYQVIIQGSGGNTINGQSQYILYLQGECVWLVNDGTGDHKILQLNNKFSYNRRGDQKDWAVNIFVVSSPSGFSATINPSTDLGTLNLCDATVGNLSITLGAQGVNYNAGSLRFIRYDNTSNTVTITPASGVTVNGSSSPISLKTKYSFIELHYTGVNTWLILSGIPYVGGTLQGTLDSSGFVMKAANAIDTSATSKDVVNYGVLLSLLSSYSVNAMTALTGDVTATGPGSSAATVARVGGYTAASIATAVGSVQNATSSKTPNTIVSRDGSSAFAAGNITADAVYLTSNATASNQAPTWSQVQNYVSQSRVNLQSVATIAIGNQNSISTANFIGTTVNGRVLATGDRIALIGQNNSRDNGIYYVDNGTGHLLRTSDCAAGVDGNGFVFGVLYGTYANNFFRISPASPSTTCIFGTDSPTYTVYFIIQNLTVDYSTISRTGSVLYVASNGIGTTQLAPYSNGGRVMGTNSSTKKPEETAISSAKLVQAFSQTQSAIHISNFGSDTLGNGWTIPYATLTYALANATGAGYIKMIGGFGATGTFTQSQDSQQIEGIGCDGTQIANITGTFTAGTGRTRLKLKDLALVGTSANPTPLVIASGNLGRNYFKNVSFIPYSTNPSLNITTSVTNWMEFDDCDFTNTINIGGSVGTGEAYTFRRSRGALYLVLTKNVPVTFIDCDAVFVVSHTAGQISIHGRSTVNIASTATLASGAFIYIEGASTYNVQTQSWGSISSACTTQLVNVSRKLANDSIAALSVNTTPITPSSASSGYYVSGVDAGGSLLYTALPAAATVDTRKLPYQIITSNYTVLSSDSDLIASAVSGAITVTLPAISTIVGGSYPASGDDKTFTITKSDTTSNAITIAVSGSDTILDNINQTSIKLINKGDSIKLKCIGNGTSGNWVIISRRIVNAENGTLNFYGNITTNTTLNAWGNFVNADCTSGNISVTLPNPTNQQGTVRIHRTDSSSNSLSVSAPAGWTINGSPLSVLIPPLYTGVFEISSISLTDYTAFVANPKAISAMTAASTSTAGTGGTVPAPQQYANNFFLRGDSTWSPLLQNWQANVTYPEQAVVIQIPVGSSQPTIWVRTIGSGAGSSSVWDTTEQGKWTQLGSSSSGSNAQTPNAKTITNANSPYPFTFTDAVINVDASSGSVIMNLPPIAGVATSSITKRFTINRIDTLSVNSVLINCNSGTTDQFLRTPSGYTTYYLDPATSVELVAVLKTGGNYWVIEDNNVGLYQSIPFDNMITGNISLTYHGKMFTVYANSNITITLPNAAWGAGSTKIYRQDSNTQYTVTVACLSGHTLNGQSSINLPIQSTITARTVASNNTSLTAELVTQNNTMIPQYGCSYGFINGTQTITANTYGKVIFSSANQTVYDPSGMWSSSNPTRFYAKVGGVYEFIGRYTFYGVAGLSGCGFWVNGAAVQANDFQYCTSASIWKSDTMFKSLTLNAGDYVEFVVTSDSANTILNCDFQMKLAQNSIGIGNQPGAICWMSQTSGPDVANNPNFTVFTFQNTNQNFTKYDPMGMHSSTVNPSRITIQVAGVYEVTCYFKAINWTAVTVSGCQILKNGIAVTDNWVPASTAGHIANSHTYYVQCAVGDYLEMRGSLAYVSSVDGVLYYAFGAKLGQGVPSNLPTIGTPGQVLTVNSTGTGLQYSTIANSSITGSVLALRQSAGQVISNLNLAITTFDTVDTELAFQAANVGITVTNNNTFTNNSGAAITITVSFMVQWPVNGSGQRYAWLQRISSGQRAGMVSAVAYNGGAGVVQSSSVTFSLANGDGFYIYVYQDSGTALTLNGGGVGLPTGYAGKIQITRIA